MFIFRRYYRHGLFLTSYPTCATSLAILAILLCWYVNIDWFIEWRIFTVIFYRRSYPLLNFSPLPGKIPTKVVLPFYQQVTAPLNLTKETLGADKRSDDEKESSNQNQKSHLIVDTDQVHNNFSSSLPSPSLPWAREPPFVYVQQIILRSVVLPWDKELALTDAFRGPLFEVFKLIEIINNHETNVTLSNLCLHVENAKKSQNDVLFPEYNCLILSPANFWRQNIHDFNKDNSLLGTIYQHHVN